MRTRGFVLPLLLGAFAALAVIAGVVWMRLDLAAQTARAGERRAQLLWLARSAALQAKNGQREVELSGERAKLTTKVARISGGSRVEAAAVFDRWGTARVAAELGPDGRPRAWQERYERR